ncbi:SDR family oxidoreductase [Chitiniphilus purpureus]|uniref:SDR family oxidoreductase n=1 Tax=Chitiniphilus purpureus TaxID=2981137 RepID=A0ABY6DN07_9NEIS|nr:SDR family NAD(P)-dependent oxidoreductase [Chitiniphilus sp. CD1]UXY15750.1 SDR family oxidoreductase [Chitiniphilus sp. CD1]
MQLQDKVALVTGASSGIGRATALRFAAEGAIVGVLGRNRAALDETVAEIETAGGRALALVADVADDSAVRDAVSRLVDMHGRLDVVFANAGINGVWAPIDTLLPQEWDKTLAINLRGTYLTIHYTVPHLKRSGGGAILVTSSINGTRVFSNSGASAYACSKAAQLALVQMLALELAPFHIRVNALCPGSIATDINERTEQRDLESIGIPVDYPQGQVPLTEGRSGTAEQVAELALFLASERSSHISGTPVWIDGAQSLLIG